MNADNMLKPLDSNLMFCIRGGMIILTYLVKFESFCWRVVVDLSNALFLLYVISC